MEIPFDTIIVSAKPEGFQKVFIEQHAWWAISLSTVMQQHLKYIAIYQTAPISSITHYAEISNIVKYKDTDRFAVYFDNPPVQISPIHYDAGSVVPQAQKYTTLNKLLKSKKLSDVMNKRKDYISK